MHLANIRRYRVGGRSDLEVPRVFQEAYYLRPPLLTFHISRRQAKSGIRPHTDKTSREVGKAHRNLATRQLLAQNDGAALIKADHMKTVLANVDADGRYRRLGCLLRHGDSPFRVLAPGLELLSRTRPVHPISGHSISS